MASPGPDGCSSPLRAGVGTATVPGLWSLERRQGEKMGAMGGREGGPHSGGWGGGGGGGGRDNGSGSGNVWDRGGQGSRSGRCGWIRPGSPRPGCRTPRGCATSPGALPREDRRWTYLCPAGRAGRRKERCRGCVGPGLSSGTFRPASRGRPRARFIASEPVTPSHSLGSRKNSEGNVTLS